MFAEKHTVEAARRLVAAAPQARVILFGSHARGEAGRLVGAAVSAAHGRRDAGYAVPVTTEVPT